MEAGPLSSVLLGSAHPVLSPMAGALLWILTTNYRVCSGVSSETAGGLWRGGEGQGQSTPGVCSSQPLSANVGTVTITVSLKFLRHGDGLIQLCVPRA